MRRAIPTTYAGVRFRSRLEADWARYFDEQGIRWAFEAEGFDIDGVAYLPDFYLPDLRTFCEVKGLLDDESEIKVRRLAEWVEDRGRIVVLAEAPAGKRWALVPADGGPLAWRGELARCPLCGAVQFMDEGGECRRCPELPARPWHDPPFTREERVAIARWWAALMRSLGREDHAEEFDAQADAPDDGEAA